MSTERPTGDRPPAQNSGGAESTRSGVALILAATVVSAASSFFVLMIVASALGPADYAQFNVFWGAMFMIIAMLFGVQQEATRGVAKQRARGADPDPATLPLNDGGALATRNTIARPSTSVFVYASWLAAALLVLLGVSSIWWAGPVFGPGGGSWGWPLAIAVAAYTVTAAANGILAGARQWRAFAALALLDGVIRFVAVATVLALQLGATALVWAVALPVPLSFMVMIPFVARKIREYSVIGISVGQLSANIARTLTASTSTSVLINGFPVFVSLFGRADQATLGAVMLAVTLTRAPILVPLNALQSMLISRLSSASAGRGRLLTTILGAIVIVTALVALGAWAFGGPVLRTFFGAGFVLQPVTLAGLVVAAGCLGFLTATGAGALSANRHSWFAAGWLTAALLALAMLALAPGPIELRVTLALIAGPLVGASVHAIALQGTAPSHTSQATDGEHRLTERERP